jgi:hypothetical protein
VTTTQVARKCGRPVSVSERYVMQFRKPSTRVPHVGSVTSSPERFGDLADSVRKSLGVMKENYFGQVAPSRCRPPASAGRDEYPVGRRQCPGRVYRMIGRLICRAYFLS